MNYDNISKACQQANAFLIAAEAAQERMVEDGQQQCWSPSGTMESAACRRASMDLTRALARMRRPE